MKNIGIIGLGNIGSKLQDIWSEQAAFSILGCSKGDDVNALVKECEIIVIAVKPQSFDALCGEISADMSGKLVISIMAGKKIETIKAKLRANKVVRTMPNLPLKVRCGFTGWIASEEVSEEEKMLVAALFNYVGTELEVSDEEKLNALTALSGSGPAYFYFLDYCMKLKALEYGFSEEEARKIVRSTFVGAAQLLDSSEISAKEWIEKISSKGGTTEAAIKIFTEEAQGAILEAIEHAHKRAQELDKNSE